MTTIYNELKETMKEAYGTEVLPEKVVTSIIFKTNISLDVEQTLKLTHETIFNDPIHLTFYTKDFIFKIINDNDSEYIEFTKIKPLSETIYVPETLSELFYSPELKTTVPFKSEKYLEDLEIKKQNKKNNQIKQIENLKKYNQELFDSLVKINDVPENFSILSHNDNIYIKVPDNISLGGDGFSLPKDFKISANVIDFIGFMKNEYDSFKPFIREFTYDNTDEDSDINQVLQEYNKQAKKNITEALKQHKIFKVIGFQEKFWIYDKKLEDKTITEIIEMILPDIKKYYELKKIQ